MKGQIRSGHPGGVQLCNQEMDVARTRRSEIESLGGISSGQNQEIRILENLLHGLAEGIRVFYKKHDRMKSSLSLRFAHSNLDPRRMNGDKNDLRRVYNKKVTMQQEFTT